jgi:UDP-GlcNAc:undecaprenyl-phosphate/decaprenyl-phosphate GlcNAc-1-phosphate transferase
MTGAWWQYLAVFGGAALLSLFLTPLAIRFALRKQVMDLPGAHKSHSSPVPYLGGLAIVVAFVVAVTVPSVVGDTTLGGSELLIVLGIALALAFIGLLDDLRGLPPMLRLIAEILAGIAVVWLGVGVTFTGIGWLNAIITVIWVVGITNAFNLLDNMDGLSAGLAAIASVSIFAVAASNGQYLVGGLSLALAGCAVGFLRHNFHPARIYMGDAGALFFGFLIAYLGVKLQLTAPSGATFLVPILICSVAVLDTSLVTVTRLLHRISPFQGGRDHLSHRLVKVGLPVPVAVSLIYGAGVSVGTVAWVISQSEPRPAWVLAVLVIALLAGAGVLLSRVPVYETSQRRHYAITEIDANGQPRND